LQAIYDNANKTRTQTISIKKATFEEIGNRIQQAYEHLKQPCGPPLNSKTVSITEKMILDALTQIQNSVPSLETKYKDIEAKIDTKHNDIEAKIDETPKNTLKSSNQHLSKNRKLSKKSTNESNEKLYAKSIRNTGSPLA